MKLPVLSLLLLCSFACKADHFLNLGFDVAVYGTDQPKGWYAAGKGYKVHLDSVVKHDGHSSVMMEGEGPTKGDFAVCTGSFPLSVAKGKSIKYTGFIKTENLTDGWAGLWWRVDGKKGFLAFDNMQSRGPKGTTEWQEFSVELETSEEATNINFGCLMAGKGKAWFDGLKVFVNGVQHNDIAPVVSEPAAGELKWLKSVISPIQSLELSSKDKDLKPIDEMAGDAQILALGEVTHGSSEIYKMKDRIIKHLVEKDGYTIFAIEANMPESYKINEYVLNGKGDPKELIKGMYFWTWDTEEMLALVNWMKEYNDQHTKKVSFTGFDMQYSDGAFAEISAECNKYTDAAVIQSLKQLDETLQDFNKSKKSYEELSVKQNDFLKDEWKSLREFATKYITDKQEREWFAQNVRVLEQSTTDIGQSQRNEFMAENLLWIRAHNPGAKIVVWAHNAHIQKTGEDMGSHIAKELKKDYVTVGFTFHDGSYLARGKEGLKAYPAQPSYPGTYEYYFHKSDVPMFLLDLRDISKTDKNSKWLYGDLEFRDVGAMKMLNEFNSFAPVANFDMLVFIDKSTNSTLLHKH